MYNRYVPQADGSFRRSRIPEQIPQQEKPPEPPPPQQEPVHREVQSRSNGTFTAPRRNYTASSRNTSHGQNLIHYDNSSVSIGSFLKGLLPQNFDTEDLMVVLLLLLMSGNSGKDQNAALMTLVIYLFI